MQPQMSDSESTLSTKALQQYQTLYLCPLTMEIMQQPYVLPCQHTFELEALKKYLALKRECPMCRKSFGFQEGAKNLLAKQGIDIYKKQLARKINKVKPLSEVYKGILLKYQSPWSIDVEKTQLCIAASPSIHSIICTYCYSNRQKRKPFRPNWVACTKCGQTGVCEWMYSEYKIDMRIKQKLCCRCEKKLNLGQLFWIIYKCDCQEGYWKPWKEN